MAGNVFQSIMHLIENLRIFPDLMHGEIHKDYHYCTDREYRIKRGKLRFFLFLGRTVWADIFGRIFLGSQKSSQMAAFVHKSKHVQSALNLSYLLSNKFRN